MSEPEATIEALRNAVMLACQPTYVPRFVAGREQVLAMPREWVLVHLEQVAISALNLADYWEYRRLLELAQLLDPALVQRLVAIGERSGDADVREAAEDFRAKPA